MPPCLVKLWVTTGCFVPCGCLPTLLTCAHFTCYGMWYWCARGSVLIHGCNIRGRGAAAMMLWALVPFLLLTWNFTLPQTPVLGPPWGTKLLCSTVSDTIQDWKVPSCCLMSWLKIHWKLAPNNHLTRPICLPLFCCYPCSFSDSLGSIASIIWYYWYALVKWILNLDHALFLINWLNQSKMAFSIHPAAVLILIMILLMWLLEILTL